MTKLSLLAGDSFTSAPQNSKSRLINFYVDKSPNTYDEVSLLPLFYGVGSSQDAYSGAPTGTGGAKGGVEDVVIVGDSVVVNTTARATGLANLGTRASLATNGNHVLIASGGVPNAFYYSGSTYSAWSLDSSTLETGTATSAVADELNDTAATFITNGVLAGMTVHNTTDDTYAKILTVHTNTRLTLDADIFPLGTEAYEIKTSYGLDLSTVNPQTCTYLDGYYIVDSQETGTRGRFYISALNDLSQWAALDFGEAEHRHDSIQCVIARQNELWLIGLDTTEVWYNSGNPDFPFEPLNNAVFSFGTSSPYTVTKVGEELMWVGTLRRKKVVCRTQGLSLEDFNFPANEPVTNEDDFDFGLSYLWNGHLFYILDTVATGAGTSYIYDTTTGVWSRAGYLDSTGAWQKYRFGYIYDDLVHYRTTLGHNTVGESGVDPFDNAEKAREIVLANLNSPDLFTKYFHASIEAVVSAIPTFLLTNMQGTATTTLATSGDTGDVDFGAMGITGGVDYLQNTVTSENTDTVVSAAANLITYLHTLGAQEVTYSDCVVSGGSPYFVTLPNDEDLTCIGLTTGTDYLRNTSTGATTGTLSSIADNVLGVNGTASAVLTGDTFEIIDGSTGDAYKRQVLKTGDSFKIIDGVTGDVLEGASFSLDLSWVDDRHLQSATLSRTGDRVTWSNLGSSRDRTYTIKIFSNLFTSIFALYADLREMRS